MRKSVKQGDPGYDPEAFKYEVFLNGVRLEHCFTADEELGEAHVYLSREEAEAAGEYSPLSPPTTILKGKVEIRRSL